MQFMDEATGIMRLFANNALMYLSSISLTFAGICCSRLLVSCLLLHAILQQHTFTREVEMEEVLSCRDEHKIEDDVQPSAEETDYPLGISIST